MEVRLVTVPFGDYEPVVSDARLSRVEDKLRREFPGLSPEAEFVSFVQPWKEVQHPKTGLIIPIEEMAVFAVVTDSPRHPGFKVMHTGAASLAGWRQADWEYSHYVAREDPLVVIYRQVIPLHLENLENLRVLV